MNSATEELLFQSDPERRSWSTLGTRCWTGAPRGVLVRGWWFWTERLLASSAGATRCARASSARRCCYSEAGRGESSVSGARSLLAGSEATALRLSAVSLAGRSGVGSHNFVQGGKRGRLQTRATKREKDEFPRERNRLGEQGYDRQRADVHRLRRPRMSRAGQGSGSHPDVGTAVLAGGMRRRLALAAAGLLGANPRSLEEMHSAAAGPGGRSTRGCRSETQSWRRSVSGVKWVVVDGAGLRGLPTLPPTRRALAA